MDVLGITAFDGPSAACLVRDGRIIAAAQEARFTRVRGDSGFPAQSISYVLRAGKIGATGLAAVVVAGSADDRVPSEQDTAPPPPPSSLGHRLKRLVGRKDTLRDRVVCELGDLRVESVARDVAHAAAAFFPSPLQHATVLVLDGPRKGARIARGDGTQLEMVGELAADEGDPAEMAVRLAHGAHRIAPGDGLVVGGPGAASRATNGQLLTSGVFRELWVQPAVAFGAEALGAALAWAHAEGAPRTSIGRGALGFGPGYTAAQIRTFLRSQGLPSPQELPRATAADQVAELLLSGREVGWFDGRVDFGQETPGSRSVLRAPGANGAAPPRQGEWLVVPADVASEYVHVTDRCPPLVDVSIRLEWQHRLGDPPDTAKPRAVAVVDARDHRGLAAILTALEKRTGMAALAARPLRPAGEPVACSPQDAWRAFQELELEVLVMGDFVLTKSSVAAGTTMTETTAEAAG
ncbi:MAG: hypothetical protein KC591_13660 [Gemmatimonadetes bacterium]|nr:hypothetical protein [Gemmatimonadota bacterium]